jgi:KaiC/GvpD/RAD55 family RecA-like ATPase
MSNRCNTGIEGFDQILDGGFLKNRAILIQGTAGTGKSTFALQFLVNGALKYNENGILLALEYDKTDLMLDVESYSWPMKELIDQKKIKVVNLPGGLENPKEMDVDQLINYIYEQCTEINAKRLVIDSLNSIELIFSKSKNMRQDLMRFITLIGELDCTSLLLAEKYSDDKSEMYSFITHGVVNLYNLRMGSNRVRALEVIKMRGVNHSSLTHSMAIESGKGIVVLPHEIDISALI